MRPIHFEAMARSMACGLNEIKNTNIDTMHPYLCEYFNTLDGHLVFGEANEIGQEVTLVNYDKLEAKLKTKFGATDSWIAKAIHDTMFGSMSKLMISLYKFHKYGQKTFNITRGLTTMLHNTDLNGTYEFLKCPYPSFYLSLEGCPIWLDVEVDHEPIVGVYVDSSRDDLTVFLAISKPSATFLGSSIWLRASIRKDMDPNSKINLDDFNFGGAERNPSIELAIKAILYMNSENPDIKKGGAERKSIEAKLKKAKEPKNVKKLDRQLRQLSVNEYMDVGESIRIKKSDMSTQDKVEFKGGFHYSYRFWTRGHFRNQAYGPGRTLRKMIFVEPFMKGPDQAQVLHKQYKVEE